VDHEGFFDSIDPSMEHAAMIDGCPLGRVPRVALPLAIRRSPRWRILSCSILGEFLFAAHPHRHNTRYHGDDGAVRHRARTQWNLMSAMAVLAMGRAVLITVFAQKYVIRGLRI